MTRPRVSLIHLLEGYDTGDGEIGGDPVVGEKRCCCVQIDGLVLPCAYRFKIPSHPSLTGENDNAPIWASLVSLDWAELPEKFSSLGIKRSSIEFFFQSFPVLELGTKTGVRSTFLIITNSADDYTIPAAEFLISSLRYYFGACIAKGRTLNAGAHTTSLGQSINPTYLHSPLVDLDEDSWKGFKIFIQKFSSVQRIMQQERDLAIAYRYITRAIVPGVSLPLEDKVLYLTIALEALLSPSDRNELSYRVAQGAAWMLSELTKGESNDYFKLVRYAYSIRSAVAHGTFSSFDTKVLNRLSIRNPQALTETLSFVVREILFRRTLLAAKRPPVKKESLLDFIKKASLGLKPMPRTLSNQAYVRKHSTMSAEVLSRYKGELRELHKQFRDQGRSRLVFQ